MLATQIAFQNVVLGAGVQVLGLDRQVVVLELQKGVLGTVRGRRVLLQTSCHVEGDIYHQTVAIEQGAFFEGKSRRTDDPIAGISRPERHLEQGLLEPASPRVTLSTE